MSMRHRTSQEIAADIDGLRHDMDGTLEELEKRLSPSRLVREAVESVGHLQAGRYLVGAVGVARRHPVGAAATAIGVTLAVSLMYVWSKR